MSCKNAEKHKDREGKKAIERERQIERKVLIKEFAKGQHTQLTYPSPSINSSINSLHPLDVASSFFFRVGLGQADPAA